MEQQELLHGLPVTETFIFGIGIIKTQRVYFGEKKNKTNKTILLNRGASNRCKYYS